MASSTAAAASPHRSYPPGHGRVGPCRAGPLSERDGVYSALVGAAASSSAFRDIEHASDSALAGLLADTRVRDAKGTECRREFDGDLIGYELVVG